MDRSEAARCKAAIIVKYAVDIIGFQKAVYRRFNGAHF
jgi:hypothetical protein